MIRRKKNYYQAPSETFHFEFLSFSKLTQSKHVKVTYTLMTLKRGFTQAYFHHFQFTLHFYAKSSSTNVTFNASRLHYRLL